jgi:flagellar protein FlaF
MGFSVSGAAAIVFATAFIAFGMWFTASANSFERVTEAKADRTDSVLATTNSDVEISNATYNGSHLVVDVTNDGAEQLSVANADLLVDGAYRTDWRANATVAGDADTRLWMGAEQLTATVPLADRPGRLKVVAGTGVADTAEVTQT